MHASMVLRSPVIEGKLAYRPNGEEDVCRPEAMVDVQKILHAAYLSQNQRTNSPDSIVEQIQLQPTGKTVAHAA